MRALHYAAIRVTEGREWIDTSTIALLPEIARENGESADSLIPLWASHNRLLRIAQVEIREVGR